MMGMMYLYSLLIDLGFKTLNNTQRAHDVKMMSYQRRCNVMTSDRRRSDGMCLLGRN